MNDIAVKVENLSKLYRIGHIVGYKTLRESITNAFTASLRHLRSNRHQPSAINDKTDTIWALKDVSFKVKRGEAVGIIGRNGSGKTTLLKILSRITAPTEGYAAIHGRVGSLLEVGTGFHPELTGRENIYLNGAVLGMTRAEVKRKFDEIVAFSEIDKFLDTPVKRYSSGMYVRLAFSVAAHLDPDILLVDEVLAVGDAAFQKKCLGKMSNVASEGRTVLFVSHNMGSVRELTGRGIWLDEGKVMYDGDTGEAIQRYLSFGLTIRDTEVDLLNHPKRLPRMKPTLKRLSCKTCDGTPSKDFHQAEQIVLELEYEAPVGIKLAGAGLIINSSEGIRVGGFNTYMAHAPPHNLPQKGKVAFVIPARHLTPGTYFVTVSVGSHPKALEDKVENALAFTVHPADIYGTGYLLTKEDGVAVLSADVRVEPL